MNFNPEKSYYHQVILNKYLRKGMRRERAIKEAKKELKESLYSNGNVIEYNKKPRNSYRG